MITRARLTKASDLAPVPGHYVVVDGVFLGIGPHFFRLHADWVYVGPPALQFFSVCPCRVLEKIERILDLT
jgi:hypothetical protein